MEKYRRFIKTLGIERTYVYIRLFNKDMCFRLGLKIEFKFRKVKEIISIRYSHI